MFWARAGICVSMESKRDQAAITLTTALHCCTTCVNGASMRPTSTEPMIIIDAPPLSWFSSSSQAPKPSMTEPINCCSSLDTAFSEPAASEARA